MAFRFPTMDAVQFERIASACQWSERSLGVAKALTVDNLPIPGVATANAMKPQQANVIHARFLARAEQVCVEEFMQCEEPRLSSAAIKRFSRGMHTLRQKGYTIEQIVAFLRKNGVSASPATVANFLKDPEA
jgi:hypothetical protein